VVFGRSGRFAPNVLASDLNGSNGFRIGGIAAFDFSGGSVSGGNLNGDGFSDLIVGAPGANPDGESSGQSYVVFGRSGGFAPVVNPADLNGSNGFRINGFAAFGRAGTSVSRAGDVNGDRITDVIIGTPFDSNNALNRGESYVVFGRSDGFNPVVSPLSLDGSNGFRIGGINAGDTLGVSVSSGDINGDSFSDLIIGAPSADPGNRDSAGQVYVVFGSSRRFAPNLNLATLNANIGFRIDGLAAGDRLGSSVSSGDVNGDGFSDVIIGAPNASPNGLNNAGRTYVVFGKRTIGVGGSVSLSNLFNSDGTRKGIKIDGAQAGERSGTSVGSTNINGDKCDDIIIGAPAANPNNLSAAGRSYVVYGNFAVIPRFSDTNSIANATRVTIGGINADLTTDNIIFSPNTLNEVSRPIVGTRTVLGTRFNDTLTGDNAANTLTGNAGDDAIVGNAGNDILTGNAGNDTLTGGRGSDRFVFSLSPRFNPAQIGIDTITDFTRGQDKILLDRSTFRGVNRISFASVRNLRDAQRSDATFTYIRSSGALYFNANGSRNGFGTGAQFADLSNGLNLSAADLQLGRA
jgi:Ca2+-binding RTX toxin-like protein